MHGFDSEPPARMRWNASGPAGRERPSYSLGRVALGRVALTASFVHRLIPPRGQLHTASLPSPVSFPSGASWASPSPSGTSLSLIRGRCAAGARRQTCRECDTYYLSTDWPARGPGRPVLRSRGSCAAGALMNQFIWPWYGLRRSTQDRPPQPITTPTTIPPGACR